MAKEYHIIWHATYTSDEEPEEHLSLGPSVDAPGTHDSPQEHWYINLENAVESFSDVPLPPPPPLPSPQPPPPSPPSPPPPRPIAAPRVHPKLPDIDEIVALTDKLKKRFRNSLQLR